MPSDLIQYLVIGSYLFGAASWAFLYKEIRACRLELEKAAVVLSYNRGVDTGQNLESRVTALERQSLYIS